jgi:ribokinase
MQAPSNLPRPPHVVVVGQLARDVVLVIDQMPEPGTAAAVRMRRETLGGRGANQAVAFAQLGLPVGLVAVVGDDRVADAMLDRAHQDGIEITHVFRRPGVETALVVEAVDADDRWRYLEDLPPETQLTVPDVEAASDALRAAAAVVVVVQQPAPVCLAAACAAREGDALVVVDGVPDAETRAELLHVVDVLRAGNQESALLVGADAGDVDALRAGGRELLDAGPRVVVLAAGDAGNLVAWRDEDGGVQDELIPLTGERTVDTTGGGDALVAAVTASLLRGDPPPTAARLGVLAAGATVTQRGGRPTLTPDILERAVDSPA